MFLPAVGLTITEMSVVLRQVVVLFFLSFVVSITATSFYRFLYILLLWSLLTFRGTFFGISSTFCYLRFIHVDTAVSFVGCQTFFGLVLLKALSHLHFSAVHIRRYFSRFVHFHLEFLTKFPHLNYFLFSGKVQGTSEQNSTF